ncbi:MAG: cation transporter [Firmicutes bacterium]|uniref:Cation transporter n=1 Tax=Candidatus Stercoripulliclostridium pullicola TaxID=2840953 RepID=A0A940DHC9_9FIRM|nr:cation transporter [Candidatus Stercoripulliclostridium pullicola]
MSETSDKRVKYGMTAGILGIVSNVVLCAAKLIVGFIGNSITIIADAVNNLSDAASSVITVFGFRISARPADKEHPFGHHRYEQISALIVAILVLAIGVLLGKSSIEKIITPEETAVTALTYIVLAVAIVLKIGQMAMYLYFSKKISSDSLRAAAADSRNDCLSTGAVLIAAIVTDVAGVNIDGYMGLAVSLFIVVSSLLLIKDTVSPLLGEPPTKEFVENVRKKLMSYDGVLGIHDLMVHNYGATSSTYVSVHVEVAARGDIMKAHDMIDNIERDFHKEGLNLTVHMDPVETDNPEVSLNLERAREILASLNAGLSLHDFRMVIGDTHTNILFDVVIPFDSKVTPKEIEKAFADAYADEGKQYFFIINYDRSYV